MIYEVTIGEKNHRVELTRNGSGWLCKLDGRPVLLDVVSTQQGVFSILLDGKSYEVKQESAAGQTNIVVGHNRFPVVVRDPRSLRARRSSDAGAHGPRKISAPMPGKVVRILAPIGTAVEAGEGVLVIEAMKMQNELKAPKKGTVIKMSVSEGAAVDAGQALAEVD